MSSSFDLRGFILFVAGIGCGIVLMQPGAAQTKGGTKLNHVAIAVKNIDAEVNYYTKTMGFRPAFTFKEPDGKPILTYLQIGRDTFRRVRMNVSRRIGRSTGVLAFPVITFIVDSREAPFGAPRLSQALLPEWERPTIT